MLRTVMTCPIYPEQYDVYDQDCRVGFIHLRFGFLSALYVPDTYAHSEEVYSYDFDDDWKGEFKDEKERKHYINLCLKKIEKHLRNDAKYAPKEPKNKEK